MKKKLPIGLSDFKEVIEENYYYVDKSLFIKEIIEDGSKVVLLPRPRRFGKTMNMSMLKYFFEKDVNNKNLFENLEISKYEEFDNYSSKFPVIFLSFKDSKSRDWDNLYGSIIRVIADEFKKHKYLLSGTLLDEEEKKYFNEILKLNAPEIGYSSALKELSQFLLRYHKEKVIILIDEYDTPIECSYVHNYYDKLISFMRNFLSGGLKDNSCLEKGVLTGILRIAKESIFSGLNNLNVCTILEKRYSEYFGLLENEVSDLLDFFEISYKLQDVKKWYNGYVFGENVVYNPWSIINYANKNSEGLKPYWINTSSNDLIRQLVTTGGFELKRELEDLLQRKSIEKKICEDISYGEVSNDTNTIWSFFLFNGYLKVVGRRVEGREFFYSLQIPNEEVYYLYEQIINGWFSRSINNDRFNMLLKSLISGDIEVFELILQEFVIRTMSYFDVNEKESESVYHAFVLGLLVALNDKYEVRSNRESGYGRYDVMLIPRDVSMNGIVFEFKSVYGKDTLETAVDKALKQIEDKKYTEELLGRGVKKIFEIGIAFLGKDILVKWNEKSA